MPPKRSRRPWRIGSRASKRFPRLAAWSPMHGRAVIDGHEDEGRPLGDRHGGRHVCAPHHVGRLGGDGPVVRLRPCAWPARGGAWRSCSRINRRTRSFEAHPRDPQLRPGFSVALAMKRRGFEPPANVGHQDVVRGSADRPAATTQGRRPCRLPPRIHTGAGAVPHAADPLHAIRPTGGDRLGATHRVDLRRAKGPPASSWSTCAYRNSVSISSSPILACSRRWSSSRASGARLFRPACPAARN